MRQYNSKSRQDQAIQTRNLILTSAKKLIKTKGFDQVTIDEIAKSAGVSSPSIYSIFQSKRGVLRALMDEVLPPKQYAQYEALVEATKTETSPINLVTTSAQIARLLYDAEKTQFDLLRTAAVVAPEFKELEAEREKRRYQRQDESLKRMFEEGLLAKGLSLAKAKDILWTFTGRDLYRMLVLERGWSSEEYEKWLTQLLIQTLIANKDQSLA